MASFCPVFRSGNGVATVPSIGARVKEIEAATRSVAHLTPEQVAMDEDYWSVIQNSFTVTRGIVNLNNGGVSPSPRIVTEALVRYIWQQEDATAYTMWQMLEPQADRVEDVPTLLDPESLLELQQAVDKVSTDHALGAYLQALITATRTSP